MLIDDHSAMGVIFKTMLTAMGCAPSDFDFCQDVEAAVTCLKQNSPYQVIFLDHSVPPTYHFRESLAMMGEVRGDTPIVLLSGMIPQDFGTDAVDARIAHCMEKDDLSAKSLFALLKSLGVPLAS